MIPLNLKQNQIAFIIILCFMLGITGSCKGPEREAKEILQLASELVKDQNKAMEDSVFSDGEITGLKKQRKQIAEKVEQSDQNLTENKRIVFCETIQEGRYDLTKTWQKSNYNLFYIHNANDYITNSQNFDFTFTGCDAWKELSTHIFMHSIQATAQKAMAEQYILARKQIEAAKDNHISDDEIQTIIQAFKNSMKTYQEIHDELSENEELMNSFEKEINQLSKRYKKMNSGQASQLENCDNYEKLSKAMFEAMYSKE